MKKRQLFFVLACFFLIAACFSFCPKGNAENGLYFTTEEKEWLKSHPKIRVANELDWPPFDYNEIGIPKGLAIDHINLLANKIGIKIEFINGFAWNKLISLFKQRKIDILPIFYKNREREAYTLFTKSYQTAKLAIFENSSNPIPNILANLNTIKIAMETNHGSIPLVKKQFPGIKIAEVDFKDDMVKMLATKKIDATIGNPFVLYHIAKEYQINNIQLASYIKLTDKEQADTSMHIGVRNDWPIFHKILEKTMDSISPSEMTALKKKWIDVSILENPNWALAKKVLGVTLLLMLFLIWHNYQLKAAVEDKTQELINLNSELEAKVKERTKDLTELNNKLNKTIEELDKLRGIIPICSSCKSIREDSGDWSKLEAYMHKYSSAKFTHGICPECIKKLYPEMLDKDGNL